MKKLFFLIGLLAFALINTSSLPPERDVGFNEPIESQLDLDQTSPVSLNYLAVIEDVPPVVSVLEDYTNPFAVISEINQEIEVFCIHNPVEEGLNQTCTTLKKSNLVKEVEINIKGPILSFGFENYQTPLLKYSNTHFGTINRFV